MSSKKIEPCVLTIAGSDSGGNAGVQADLRAFHVYGLHGCTVFAALTAQNPFGVKSVHPVPPKFIADQLDAVLDTYNIAALKTGMLATPAAIRAVAEKLKNHGEIKKVIDPVMVATSGAKLIADEAIDVLKKKLLPLATLITPNLPEAEVLLRRKITSVKIEDAVKELSQKFSCAVLVKGGHAKGRAAEDVLFDGSCISRFSLPRLAKPISTHGTGCSLAAALAAEFACGASIKEAVEGAKHYVYNSIRFSYYVGKKCGVLGTPEKRK